jgi:hypothetical protein
MTGQAIHGEDEGRLEAGAAQKNPRMPNPSMITISPTFELRL